MMIISKMDGSYINLYIFADSTESGIDRAIPPYIHMVMLHLSVAHTLLGFQHPSHLPRKEVRL